MLGSLKRSLATGGTFYIYALGICIMCGRQISRWHIGYGLFGFPLFFVVVIVYSFAFFCLTFSFAEMVSIVPFSGGCYGYSRCSLGPAIGYVAGMMETGKYVLYAVISLNRLTAVFRDVYNFHENYLIAMWIGFLVVVNVVQYVDIRLLWWTVGLVGVMITIVQIIFIFGATDNGSVQNIQSSTWDSSPSHFIKAFPYATYLLSALDAVRTCLDEQGNDVVPKALIRIMIWSALVAVASIIAQSAYTADDSLLAKEDYAYNLGLRLDLPRNSPRLVTFYSLPGALGGSLGFLYCAARQVRSMASSGLLPAILASGQGQKVKDSSEPAPGATAVVPSGGVAANAESASGGKHKPTMALLAVSILTFCLLVAGLKTVNNYGDVYSQMGQLLNAIMYWFLMSAYMVFSTRFSSMERGLKSPLGIPGAVIAFAFFILLFAITMNENPDINKGLGITLTIFVVCVVVYYYLVVQHTQFFSKEEQEKFMKAYVMNANKSRKKGKSNSRHSNRSNKSLGSIVEAIVGNVMGNSNGGGMSSRGSSFSGKGSVGGNRAK